VLLFLFVVVALCRIEMPEGTGRNDAAIAEALNSMTQVLAQAQGNAWHRQQDQGEKEK